MSISSSPLETQQGLFPSHLETTPPSSPMDDVNFAADGDMKASETSKSYTRAHLEALRFSLTAAEQRLVWLDAYGRLLAAGVAAEYDGLAVSYSASAVLDHNEEEPSHKRQEKKKMKGNNNNNKRKKQHPISRSSEEMSEVCTLRNLDIKHNPQLDHAKDYDDAAETEDISEVLGDDNGESTYYDGEENSDDEYENILRPAFAVEGEPDFESGDPVDGFEYLRRVRWEAARVPKVVVAKIDLSTSRNEQTSYMPEIPELPKCPVNLLPSKHWVEAFLSSFAEIRLGFMQLDNSCDETSAVNGSTSKQVGCAEPQRVPTVTMFCGMDAVARVATLRNYIDMVESLPMLSRNDCLWLFTLCVTVDTPLHAETSASLRSLLRKCLSILATKSEIDDEVAMLNILVTIAGKYFGQYENI